jgi:hypothetical protein
MSENPKTSECQRAVTHARQCVIQAKDHELAIHQKMIKLQERLAALEQDLGHPDRAAQAHARAAHARQLYRLALAEQKEQDRHVSW